MQLLELKEKVESLENEIIKLKKNVRKDKNINNGLINTGIMNMINNIMLVGYGKEDMSR